MHGTATDLAMVSFVKAALPFMMMAGERKLNWWTCGGLVKRYRVLTGDHSIL